MNPYKLGLGWVMDDLRASKSCSLILETLLVRCDDLSANQSVMTELTTEIWAVVSTQAFRCNQSVRQLTSFHGIGTESQVFLTSFRSVH